MDFDANMLVLVQSPCSLCACLHDSLALTCSKIIFKQATPKHLTEDFIGGGDMSPPNYNGGYAHVWHNTVPRARSCRHLLGQAPAGCGFVITLFTWIYTGISAEFKMSHLQQLIQIQVSGTLVWAGKPRHSIPQLLPLTLVGTQDFPGHLRDIISSVCPRFAS